MVVRRVDGALVARTHRMLVGLCIRHAAVISSLVTFSARIQSHRRLLLLQLLSLRNIV